MKTLVELRKVASELGIKNYSKFSKEELEVLISQKSSVVIEVEADEELTEEETLIVTEAEVIDLSYSDEIVEVKKERKTRTINMEIPDYGTQSRKIYDYIKEHIFDKSFTVYRVCQVLNTPSNNTRRIYLKFFAQERETFLLQNHLEEMSLRVEEPILVIS